jgi:hypothetical protein
MATRAEVKNTRWSNIPRFDDDVVRSVREDFEKGKRGRNVDSSNLRGGAREAVREAGKRADNRNIGRANLSGAALQFGYDAGRYIDEKTGAGKKLVDATGLGRATDAVVNKRDKVTMNKDAKQRLEDYEDAEIARKVDEDIAGEKATKREVDYKKGGMTKSKASSRADGIAQRGKTRGKMV